MYEVHVLMGLKKGGFVVMEDPSNRTSNGNCLSFAEYLP